MDAKFRYCAPPEGPIGTYRQFISTFPLAASRADRLEIFGLHLNADITFHTTDITFHTTEYARDRHLAAAAQGRRRRRRQVVR
jgi:hypothetical protein